MPFRRCFDILVQEKYTWIVRIWRESFIPDETLTASFKQVTDQRLGSRRLSNLLDA